MPMLVLTGKGPTARLQAEAMGIPVHRDLASAVQAIIEAS